MKKALKLTAMTTLVSVASLTQLPADQVINDDLIVDGSICAGLDCFNGESFGFDTLRLKENNLRIRAQDTSSSASFPSNDWQITFNESSNGGQNKFSIDDIDGGRTPFTIEAGAASHSLYVDDGGRIGLGTSTPVVQVHMKDGNTPTYRLEQDGSSGFTPQTWDVAGNEANFFIRDASNGSTLPFRIFPGAPSNALNIEGTTGDIGIGTTSPAADTAVHVRRTSSGAKDMLLVENNGPARIALDNTASAAADVWRLNHASDGSLRIANIAPASGTPIQLALSESGDLTISGDFFSTTCPTGMPCAPDYVFKPDYPLMPLPELEAFIAREGHLPEIPSAAELTGPISLGRMQMSLLKKIEELTLYTLQQEQTIFELKNRLSVLESK